MAVYCEQLSFKVWETGEHMGWVWSWDNSIQQRLCTTARKMIYATLNTGKHVHYVQNSTSKSLCTALNLEW